MSEAMKTNSTISTFRVFHRNSHCIATAKLTGNVARVYAGENAQAWFEGQRHGWLSEFRREVGRLCKMVGHFDSHSICESEDSGIRVERV